MRCQGGANGARSEKRSKYVYKALRSADGIRDVERSRGLGDVYKRQYLHLFSEQARLAPPWPLTSSHLNTASVNYLRDLSSFSLLSTLLLYYPCCRFLYLSLIHI